MGGREKRDVGEEGEKYKYPLAQWSLKSRQCRGSTAVVLLSGSASLLVQHCRTRPDNKVENSEQMVVLAEQVRMYVYKIEHLVAHFSKFIVSPFIVRYSYTQIQNIKEFKPSLSLKPSIFVIGGSSIESSSLVLVN